MYTLIFILKLTGGLTELATIDFNNQVACNIAKAQLPSLVRAPIDPLLGINRYKTIGEVFSSTCVAKD